MDAQTALARSCVERLDKITSDLASLGFYNLADRLEELTGDLEDKMLDKGMLEGEEWDA